MKRLSCLIALFLVACGKEAPPPASASAAETKKAVQEPRPVLPPKKLPPVPQGKLPQMDPDKAKFIAVPSTPKDAAVTASDKPASNAKKADSPPAKAPVSEVKKPVAPAEASVIKAAEDATPEVKKAELPAKSGQP